LRFLPGVPDKEREKKTHLVKKFHSPKRRVRRREDEGGRSGQNKEELPAACNFPADRKKPWN